MKRTTGSVFREQALMLNLVGMQGDAQHGTAIQNLRSRLAVIALGIRVSSRQFSHSTAGNTQNPFKPTPLQSLMAMLQSDNAEFRLIVVTYADQDQNDRAWLQIQKALTGRNAIFIEYDNQRGIPVNHAIGRAYARTERTDAILLRGLDARADILPVEYSNDPLDSLRRIEERLSGDVNCPVVLWVSGSYYALGRKQALERKAHLSLPVIDLEDGLQPGEAAAPTMDDVQAPHHWILPQGFIRSLAGRKLLPVELIRRLAQWLDERPKFRQNYGFLKVVIHASGILNPKYAVMLNQHPLPDSERLYAANDSLLIMPRPGSNPPADIRLPRRRLPVAKPFGRLKFNWGPKGEQTELSETERMIFNKERIDALERRGVSPATALMFDQARVDGRGDFTGVADLKERIISHGFWRASRADAVADRIIRTARDRIAASLNPPVASRNAHAVRGEPHQKPEEHRKREGVDARRSG